jgi:hypothetical protein
MQHAPINDPALSAPPLSAPPLRPENHNRYAKSGLAERHGPDLADRLGTHLADLDFHSRRVFVGVAVYDDPEISALFTQLAEPLMSYRVGTGRAPPFSRCSFAGCATNQTCTP